MNGKTGFMGVLRIHAVALSRRLRRLRPALAIGVFLTCAFGAQAAHAAACVEVDTGRDNLEPQDRDASRTLFEQSLIDNGQQVVAPGVGCTEIWRIYAVRLGTSVTTTVNSPTDRRTMHVHTVDDLPNAYSQMIKSLLSKTSINNEGSNIDRTNVTQAQTYNNRVSADSVWYIRLGLGAVAADGVSTGPGFGFGWRKEFDRLGLDLSFLNMVVTQDNDEFKDFSGAWVKLGVLFYFDPFANNSFYAGGGLSWGNSFVDVQNRDYSNMGIHGELTAGYELFRASNVRLLIQFDASLPTYTAVSRDYDLYSSPTQIAPTSTRDSIYTPSFTLSLGIGFGKSHTLAVREVH